MRNKFKANVNHYPTNNLKITYTESRISGEVILYIIPYMRDTTLNQFKTINKILNLLS
jgi:hypothetical protein